MKKFIGPAILVGVMAVVLVIGYVFLIKPVTQEGNNLKVAATIYPLADIVENIAGDKIEVVNIVPPGASPHTFEVTPSSVKELQGAEIIFAIGDPLDTWTADLLSAVDGTEVLTVDDGIDRHEFQYTHHHEEADHEEDEHEHEEADHEEEEHGHGHEHEDGELDPHYWLSTNNAKIIAGNVAAELSWLDPENAEVYQSNLLAYQAELDQVHEEIESILKSLSSRELIVFHESWNYFADEFDLEIAGVFTTSPGKEPTPSELAELHDTAEEHGITAVFSEPQLSPETIRPFVEDLDLELYVLDPLGGIDERDSLINTLKYNAQTIQQALGK